MDQIQYAGNTLVTGSDLAHAVLAYAQALASRSESATIRIPVRHDDGTVVTAEILIGPASQLITEPVEWSGPELEDAAVVAQLTEWTMKLRPARAVTEPVAEISAVDASELDVPGAD